MTREEVAQAIVEIIEDIVPDEDCSNLDGGEQLRSQLELDSMDFLDIVMELRKKYGVEVPENPYLGNVSAPEDLLTAARAWAEGEIANVEMYDELLAMTDDANLERVLTNLQRASEESHLPLFELAAENGGTLSPDQMPSHQGQGGGQSAGEYEGEHAGQAMQPQMRGEARGPGQHQ